MTQKPAPNQPVAGSNRTQRGFTLIEILVALVILTIGLLGLAALQTTSLRGNSSALMRSRATMMASGILDRMRANHKQAPQYVTAFSDTAPTSPGTQVETDLALWKNQIAGTLPGGKGAIKVNGTCDDYAANCRVTVTIQWQGMGNPLQQPTNPASTDSTQYYTIQTQL